MALSNFVPDSDEINKISRSPEMRAALREVAAKAGIIARGMSEDFAESRAYIDSFDTGSTTVDWKGEYPGMRGCAILINRSGHAAAVEWGNAHNKKPHHVMTRTLAALSE